MKRIRKILNPFIWMFNVMNYFAHLEGNRLLDEYEPYDFDQDVKYF